ncbi:MAG: FRG domain-containing protein [Bacteroidales bacterium]|nr:FRG domain-containing protein [Bacteroidales bacterium]
MTTDLEQFKNEIFQKYNHLWITEKPVRTLSQYFRAVYILSNNYNTELWFRGHAKDTYKNIPTLYREQTKYEVLNEIREFDTLQEFKRKSKIKKDTDYEYLHLMQHYGLPTRLLDWTTSSILGLFFAIHDHDECDNPHVWIITPKDFNKFYHEQNKVYNFFGSEVDPKIKGYFNIIDEQFDNLPENPIAVLPSFYDERVIAQKSCFILFGRNNTPLENLIDDDVKFDLSKITIDNDSVWFILEELNQAGINYYSVYPDIEGLVKDLKLKWRHRI